ncbi:hypothetical protein DPMN_057775 [Dreissena polymorpha]|uniref:Uncharacterized protein n=1 Tax=Dreissena polymorpha TaxID=45954 RepID=A0A9D4HFA6_DREPO|nr:hypothetical protein DPMN_057775 [Dreissena polymorpha]
MLAEYLSGGLRVFAGLVKVVDLSRCQDFLSIYGPPQEALFGPPVGLLIPTDVDMCWTPY